MRRLSAALALAAAACAGRAVPTPEALAGTIPEGNFPLEAWLSHARTSELAFTVNQPAYVAIFHIVPGRGVSMLYPHHDDELDLTRAGYNVPGYRYDPGRWYYTSASFGRTGAGPSYLFLVASREPLHVERYDRHPGLLRRTLGFTTFASYDQWAVMDELTRLVVPPQPDDAWSTDLVVLWPPAMLYASAFDDGMPRVVRCDNGRVLMVPRDYPYQGCPFFTTYRPPAGGQPAPTPPDSATPPDSTGGPPVDRPEPPSPPKGRPLAPPAEGDSARPFPGRRGRETAGGASSLPALRDPSGGFGRRTREAYPAEAEAAGGGRLPTGTASARRAHLADPWSAGTPRRSAAPRIDGERGGASGARAAGEPRADRPATDRAERPQRAERPAPERPAPERPAPERPAAERPSAERPSAERPSAERPSAERPAERPHR